MPSGVKRPCSEPGCPRFAEVRGKCAPHASEADLARGSAAERGYDHAWRQLREAYIREHPLCEIKTHCKGIIPDCAATEVDHIIPIKDRPDLRMVWSNLQSSCVACNRAKQQRDRAARRVSR